MKQKLYVVPFKKENTKKILLCNGLKPCNENIFKNVNTF